MNFAELHQAGVEAYFAGNYRRAERLWRQAVRREPRAVGTHTNHGAALHDLGRYAEALAAYDRALALLPDHPEAFSNRARTLIELRRYVEALRDAERAIELQQGYVDAWVNRAAAQKMLQRFDEALASADWALMLSPGLPAALLARGNALMELNRHAEALELFQGLPPSLNVHVQMGVCYQYAGQHRAAIDCFDRALALKPDAHDVISNKIFSLDFIDEATIEQQQDARRQWWRGYGAKLFKQRPRLTLRSPGGRVVLGYVSSDFRRHSAATTFWSVLSHHDHCRFEVICYSCSTMQDDVTRDFVQVADRFIEASQLSDEQLARRVCNDEVDILIDLSGHSGGNRLGVFARKPAPIQVTAWGHATGTGLPTMDYLFSDPVTIPPEMRHHFAEKIIDLPCALTISLPATSLVSRARDVWPTLVFGVFQRVAKVSDAAVAAWAQILHRVPGARLLMKDGNYDDPAQCEVMRARFAAHGVYRIDFLGNTTREEHLAAFGQVDIALDPFPHNGGVSTWEPLTQGVPVVSLLGLTPPGRIAAAILVSLDLGGFVAGSVEAYIIKAVQMAGRPEVLAQLRQELPRRVAVAPSGNAALYTAAVERAYLDMLSATPRREPAAAARYSPASGRKK